MVLSEWGALEARGQRITLLEAAGYFCDFPLELSPSLTRMEVKQVRLSLLQVANRGEVFSRQRRTWGGKHNHQYQCGPGPGTPERSPSAFSFPRILIGLQPFQTKQFPVA